MLFTYLWPTSMHFYQIFVPHCGTTYWSSCHASQRLTCSLNETECKMQGLFSREAPEVDLKLDAEACEKAGVIPLLGSPGGALRIKLDQEWAAWWDEAGSSGGVEESCRGIMQTTSEMGE